MSDQSNWNLSMEENIDPLDVKNEMEMNNENDLRQIRQRSGEEFPNFWQPVSIKEDMSMKEEPLDYSEEQSELINKNGLWSRKNSNPSTSQQLGTINTSEIASSFSQSRASFWDDTHIWEEGEVKRERNMGSVTEAVDPLTDGDEDEDDHGYLDDDEDDIYSNVSIEEDLHSSDAHSDTMFDPQKWVMDSTSTNSPRLRALLNSFSPPPVATNCDKDNPQFIAEKRRKSRDTPRDPLRYPRRVSKTPPETPDVGKKQNPPVAVQKEPASTTDADEDLGYLDEEEEKTQNKKNRSKQANSNKSLRQDRKLRPSKSKKKSPQKVKTKGTPKSDLSILEENEPLNLKISPKDKSDVKKTSLNESEMMFSPDEQMRQVFHKLLCSTDTDPTPAPYSTIKVGVPPLLPLSPPPIPKYIKRKSVTGNESSEFVLLSPKGDIADEPSVMGGYINDHDLVTCTVKELNRRFEDLPKALRLKYKQRRRTLKNRQYAYNCRQKRLSHRHELESLIRILKAEIRRHQAEITRLVGQTRKLREANEALRKEMEALKRGSPIDSDKDKDNLGTGEDSKDAKDTGHSPTTVLEVPGKDDTPEWLQVEESEEKEQSEKEQQMVMAIAVLRAREESLQKTLSNLRQEQELRRKKEVEQLQTLQKTWEKEYFLTVQRMRNDCQAALHKVRESVSSIVDKDVEIIRDEDIYQTSAVEHGLALQKQKEEWQVVLQKENEEHEVALLKMKEEHEVALENIKEEHQSTLQKLKEEYELALQEAKREHEKSVECVKKEDCGKSRGRKRGSQPTYFEETEKVNGMEEEERLTRMRSKEKIIRASMRKSRRIAMKRAKRQVMEKKVKREEKRIKKEQEQENSQEHQKILQQQQSLLQQQMQVLQLLQVQQQRQIQVVPMQSIQQQSQQQPQQSNAQIRTIQSQPSSQIQSIQPSQQIRIIQSNSLSNNISQLLQLEQRGQVSQPQNSQGPFFLVG